MRLTPQAFQESRVFLDLPCHHPHLLGSRWQSCRVQRSCGPEGGSVGVCVGALREHCSAESHPPLAGTSLTPFLTSSTLPVTVPSLAPVRSLPRELKNISSGSSRTESTVMHRPLEARPLPTPYPRCSWGHLTPSLGWTRGCPSSLPSLSHCQDTFTS